MEKVDLSKAQAGWTAHFRCGGSAVIESAKNSKVLFYDCEKPLQFYPNGRYLVPDVSTPFDIIRLEPPAFDWDDVKPGDGFTMAGCFLYYIGKDMRGTMIFHNITDNVLLRDLPIDDLKRNEQIDVVTP